MFDPPSCEGKTVWFCFLIGAAGHLFSVPMFWVSYFSVTTFLLCPCLGQWTRKDSVSLFHVCFSPPIDNTFSFYMDYQPLSEEMFEELYLEFIPCLDFGMINRTGDFSTGMRWFMRRNLTERTICKNWICGKILENSLHFRQAKFISKQVVATYRPEYNSN